VENLIKNFQAKPSIPNKSDLKSNKSSIEMPKKSVVSNKSNNNNNENIFISAKHHTRNKSNIFAPTPNPIDDEAYVDNENHHSNKMIQKPEQCDERENSKSTEKANRPPKDKKVTSSLIHGTNNNNELLYSKDLKRESNHNKNKKGFGEKNKLYFSFFLFYFYI